MYSIKTQNVPRDACYHVSIKKLEKLTLVNLKIHASPMMISQSIEYWHVVQYIWFIAMLVGYIDINTSAKDKCIFQWKLLACEGILVSWIGKIG